MDAATNVELLRAFVGADETVEILQGGGADRGRKVGIEELRHAMAGDGYVFVGAFILIRSSSAQWSHYLK